LDAMGRSSSPGGDVEGAGLEELARRDHINGREGDLPFPSTASSGRMGDFGFDEAGAAVGVHAIVGTPTIE
jgi:hypothetical protein